MLIEKNLASPKDIKDQVEKSAERAKEFNKSRKEKLSEEKTKEIQDFCDKKFSEWKKNTSKLRKNLVDLNNELEGVVPDTNFPFEGASNITLHYAASSARTLRASFNATLFQNPKIFIAEFSKDAVAEKVVEIEDAINSTFADGSNGLSVLREACIPVFRDGTMILSGSWKREVETSRDSRDYSSSVKFMADYPDAESAGVDDEEYQEILNLFLIHPDLELKVNYDYSFIVKDEPFYEIIPLSNFIFGPTYSKSIPEMDYYGSFNVISPGILKEKGVSGEYYKKGVEKVIEGTKEQSEDNWSASRNFVEGISVPSDSDMAIEIADMVIKYDLDGDGVREKYLVSFAPQSKTLLSFMRYPIRKNIDFCVEFRFLSRDNRFLGVSLLGQTRDLFQELDSIHRHRENIRTMVASPIFAANSDMKSELDPGRSENTIKPGMTLWGKDINNLLRQVSVTNLDQPGNSLDEENILSRYAELSIGTSQGLSGQQTPGDPRAPMGKTLALLNQSNKRVDDYINEFSYSLPRLAQLHVALYSQYGDKEGITTTVDREGMPKKISVTRSELLDSDIKWKFTKRSVAFSSEYVMQRVGGLMQVYMQLLPLLIKQDPIAVDIWNRMVIASGEPNAEKLISPTQPPPQMQQPQGQPQQPNILGATVSPVAPTNSLAVAP